MKRTAGALPIHFREELCCELFQETEPITPFKTKGRNIRAWTHSLSYSEESNIADSKSKRDLYDCIVENKAQPQY